MSAIEQIRAEGRRLRLTMPEPAEAQILRAVLHALSLHPRVAWAERMNTGAGKLLRRSGASQWIKFGFEGLSDVIGQTTDGLFIAIEVKRPSGTVRTAQAAFLERVRGVGGISFVARNVDDVWAALG